MKGAKYSPSPLFIAPCIAGSAPQPPTAHCLPATRSPGSR
ncbi:hypothetical protein E2C01_097134 [Portunus trituberculatus]|uniref:Uncharacterized protein n=1 Tax=Portunus trituberculatus TaxID=210409 RepID=A0A5B7K3P9_PORTR|nr:hypothetical protein [Portunus trituberculatus]